VSHERAGFIAELRARRTIMADKVKQIVRDVDHANRLYPDWEPLTVDDAEGSLARACRMVGLDLADLERDARGTP
jgi:hypothetical protein